MEKTTTETLLLFPCPGCNAQLYFEPGGQQLNCPHCGTNVPINTSGEPLKESDLQSFLKWEGKGTETVEQHTYKCTRCGTPSSFSTDTTKFICGSCNYEVTNPVAFKTRTVQPSALIPFKVNEARAHEIIRGWLDKDYDSREIKKESPLTPQLQGVYLPYWMFSSKSISQWSGDSGSYYYETWDEKDKDGNIVTHREQHTKWTPRSGTHKDSFKDILIDATTKKPLHTDDNFPYHFEELVSYNDSYLSGFEAYLYDVELSGAYKHAEYIMQRNIKDDCINACRDDDYRDLEVKTTYSNQTFKLILIPIWLGTIAYKGKNYYFSLNGQTGKLQGEKPSIQVPTWKILLFLIIAGVIGFFILKFLHFVYSDE
jgi:DNA-directed RNA polymerase subunit RPC12/RpoP